MLKRNSQFTLIELIVVIVVLGILAAIVIPNISSFQDEAREVQLTADARNVQTALDMFQAKSDSGTEQPTNFAASSTDTAVVHSFTAETEGENGVPATFNLINMDQLKPDYLRKTPKYVKNADVVGAAGFTAVTVAGVAAEADYNKGQVIAAVLLKDSKSTSIVNFVAALDSTEDGTADKLKVVR